MHFGVILPNYGEGSGPEGIRRVAEAAEELGFDSVGATEHIIVGSRDHRRVPRQSTRTAASMTADHARLDRRLDGPDRPWHVDRARAAARPDASGEGGRDATEALRGRFTLGVGMGWHEDEFDFMGVEFTGRGRRGDEGSG